MRNFRLKRLWPDLPSRLVLRLSVITIIIIPLLIVESDTNASQPIAILLLQAFAGLELVEYLRYKEDVPPKSAAITLLLRICIAETVIYFTDYSLVFMLYGLIMFNAYFTLGPRISNGLAICYVVISFLHQVDTFGPLQTEPLHSWIIQQLVMIFLLFLARAFQREKEQQQYTEKLLKELQVSHRELQVYATQIAELAAAEERNRLARDIHDSVGHHLTAITIQLEKALAYRIHDLDQSFQAVRDAKQAAHQALRDVRESVAGLREMDAALRLKSSLKTLIDQVATHQLPVEFQFSGDEADYNRMVLLTLYRIAQEGLTNIQKHAKATYARLDVQLGTEQAQMRLTDNGSGFGSGDSASVLFDNSGYGLQGIRERVEILRGQVTIDSVPAQGTTLLIIIPKDPITLTAGVL
jgi:signal transduction histidine kinase